MQNAFNNDGLVFSMEIEKITGSLYLKIWDKANQMECLDSIIMSKASLFLNYLFSIHRYALISHLLCLIFMFF